MSNNVAIEILKLSNDGVNLAGPDLALVELVVNGNASAEGKAKMAKLYEDLRNGVYEVPWLQGITGLTESGGYILYNGNDVEHYDEPYSPKNKSCLVDLASRCAHIEELGIKPSSHSVVWRWDWMRELKSESPWISALATQFSLWERPGQLLLHKANGEVTLFRSGGVTGYSSLSLYIKEREAECSVDVDDGEYHVMRKLGFGIPQCGQPEHNGLIYAPLSGLLSKLAEFGVEPTHF